MIGIALIQCWSSSWWIEALKICARLLKILQAACSVMTTFRCTGAPRVRSWASLAIGSVQRHDLADARLLTSRKNYGKLTVFPWRSVPKTGEYPWISPTVAAVSKLKMMIDQEILGVPYFWTSIEVWCPAIFPWTNQYQPPHLQEKKDRGFSWNGVLDLVIVSRTILWLCSMMTMSFLVYQWMQQEKS